MSYIVKNCPSTYLNFEDKYVCTSQIKEKGFPFYCQDCTDCVIKQVIEKCKHLKSALDYDKSSMFVAQEILDMFEIERVEE